MVRDTRALNADHTRISELPSDMASDAAGLQSAATESIHGQSFFGRADLSSSDSELFGDTLQSVGSQPAAVSPPQPRLSLSENAPQPPFSGQNFVETGPEPVQGPPASVPIRPASRSGEQRGEQERVEGVPQISGAKQPAKPFYIGLVGVPGVGFMNTVFSKSPSGEFDPTREATQALLAQPLSESDTSQTRALTPAVVRLNINPKDIILTSSKKVTAQRVRANYVRRELASVTGFTVEHHWDELDVISVNCTTGNFWVNGGLHYPRGGSADTPVANSNQAGFLSANRSKSLAYRKLQAVMAMFRNNGCGWLTAQTSLRSSEEQQFFGKDFNIIVNPGSAFMMYDNIIWYGHFESMSVNERGDNPNSFDFSIEFKVARTVDLNGVSDADVLTGSEIGGESFFTDSVKSDRQTITGDARAAIIEDARVANIRDSTREALEREKKIEVAKIIENNSADFGSMDDEQINRLASIRAAETIAPTASRNVSGG